MRLARTLVEESARYNYSTLVVVVEKYSSKEIIITTYACTRSILSYAYYARTRLRAYMHTIYLRAHMLF